MSIVVHRSLVSLCVLALSSWAAAATLYKWVDADGVVHYSDTPHAGAQVIQVSGAQTYHGTPVPAAPVTVPAGVPPAANSAAYVACGIAQPANETALFAPEAVDVNVQSDPALRPGDQVSVQIDGQALTPLGNDGLRFQVQAPERGSHTLTAQIRGADGSVLCNAPAVNFSVQRPSVNSPASPVRPH
jgi:hypothetical protein